MTWPGLEPRPLDLESSEMISRPLRVPLKGTRIHTIYFVFNSDSFYSLNSYHQKQQYLTVFSLACFQFLPLLVEVIRILPLVLCLIIFWHTDQRRYLAYGILSFFAILVLLTLTALVPTGGSKPGRLERISR